MSLISTVIVSGAHSTGKTTLLNDLQETGHLSLEYVQEVAREIIAEEGLTRSDFDPKSYPDVFESLQLKILRRQWENERYYREMQKGYITERGLDAVVYAQMYLDEKAFERVLNSQWTNKCIQYLRESLVFVITPHPECIADDNVRLTSSLSELVKFNSRLKTLMQQNDIQFTEIQELDRRSRVRQILETVDQWQEDI